MNAKVHLVGAGPGDPELLTVKALKLLQRADAIVCDRLVSSEILQHVNPHTRFHDVGKIVGSCRHHQQEINRLLLSLARAHDTVVRLKGGDPFVFGRGGEEMLFLARHGIEVEIVPGITAAVGCSAAAGIPLTHRGLATSVRFVTGHLRDNRGLSLDWQSMTDPGCTLVFYMAVASTHEIVSALIRHGRPPSTPVALVHSGTTPTQCHTITTLDEVPTRIAAFPPPTLMIIGEVVRLHDEVDLLRRHAGTMAEPLSCISS